MSNAIETIWGLLVDDGSLAIGIVVALALSALATAAGSGLVDLVGWILAAMLLVLLVTNLYRAGRNAAR
jgi:predicted tellurium resistance membrane protein TerC